MRLIAVDPGVRTGIALVDTEAREIAAAAVQGDNAARTVHAAMVSRISAPWHVVIEVPRIHSIDRLKGDANDIVNLSHLAGIIRGAASVSPNLAAPVEVYAPAQWKGTVKKEIHQARIERELRARKLDAWLAAWGGVDHNGRDAIALALWWLDCRKVAL